MKRLGVFDVVAAAIFMLLCALTIYPFVYALSYSVSDSLLAAQKGVYLWPQGFTLDNYRVIFSGGSRIVRALFISIAKTASGTILFVFVTGLCAFALSRRKLVGRRFLTLLFTIPLYVSGGLLPYYVLIHQLHLMNNFLVFIVPGSFSAFFMLLMRAYIDTIPEALEESARMDGAGNLLVAFRIFAPLCLPVIATVSLFVGVSQWNAWFDALLFVTRAPLQPLQLVLQLILQESQIENIFRVYEIGVQTQPHISSESYKMAVLIITTLPIVFLYPFAQRYFVKGMMVGAIKL